MFDQFGPFVELWLNQVRLLLGSGLRLAC